MYLSEAPARFKKEQILPEQCFRVLGEELYNEEMKEKQLRYSKVQIILNALVGRFGFLIILYTTTNDTIEFLLKCHRNS